MKSLIIALIISAIIITGGILFSNSIENLSYELKEINSSLIEYVNDGDYIQAQKALNSMNAVIEENAVLLGAYIDHNELDKIRIYISQLDIYLKEEEKVMANSTASSLDMIFTSIPADYHVRLENIF